MNNAPSPDSTSRFDGRVKFDSDKNIESLLSDHFRKECISPLEAVQNFPVYARRIHLKRFLSHYELFQRTINLPGDIVELGVFGGVSLLTWANFLEIRNMGDRQKQVFGFDNFEGFKRFDPEDGRLDPTFKKEVGGFRNDDLHRSLLDAIKIFDSDRFIPYKPRIRLIQGDIEETVPQFIENNPGLRISLLHFDCDLFKPTLVALNHLFPLVVSGGVVLFDEYGIRPWGGESEAVDQYFKGSGYSLKRFDWTSNPGGYLIK